MLAQMIDSVEGDGAELEIVDLDDEAVDELSELVAEAEGVLPEVAAGPEAAQADRGDAALEGEVPDSLASLGMDESEYDLDEAGPLDDANIEARLAELQGEPAAPSGGDGGAAANRGASLSEPAAGEAEPEAIFSSDFDGLLEQAAGEPPSGEAEAADDFMADIQEVETEEIELPKVDLDKPFVDDVIELSDDSDEKGESRS